MDNDDELLSKLMLSSHPDARDACARIREQRDLLDECERALTYYAATVSESRRCYAVNLLAKLRSQEKADE